MATVEEARPSMLWDRLVAICGTDDPSVVSYYTGISYPTATRLKKGVSGKEGPRAADLAEIIRNLAEKRRAIVTMGQLWGTEPLAPATAPGLGELVERALPLAHTLEKEGNPPPAEPPPPASRAQPAEPTQPHPREKGEDGKRGQSP